jgi:hypothetical protein
LIQLWHIVLVLALVSFSALPAWAGDEFLKSIMNGDGPPVIEGDGGTPQNSDPSEPPAPVWQHEWGNGDVDDQGMVHNYVPNMDAHGAWDDPANADAFAPNISDGVTPLSDGARCTGDSRCAGQDGIASGTGRPEQYYHAPDLPTSD